MRKSLIPFYGAIIVAILLVWGLQTLLGPLNPPVPGLLYGLIILATVLGTSRIRSQAARRDRIEETDSVERRMADQAKVGAFADVALGGVIIGAALLVLGSTVAGVSIIGLVAAGLVSFFIRSAILKRHLNAVG